MAIAPEQAAARADDKLPFSALAMAVLSFLSLSITGNAPFLILFSAALVASQASSWRLLKNSAGAWIARTIVLGAVLISIILQPEIIRGTLYFTLYLQLAAQLCAGELVVQCWQSPPATTPRAAGTVLLSGIVFLASSTNFNDKLVWYVTPAYLLLMLVTLRQFRPRARRSNFHRWTAGLVGLGALSSALLLGMVVSTGVFRYRHELTNWFMQLVLSYRAQESTGMSERPRLGRMFELRRSPRRVMKLQNAPGPLHLRGTGYDFYNDGAWGPDLDYRQFETGDLNSLQRPVPPSARRVTVTRLMNNFRILFVPLHALRVDADSKLSFAPEFGGPLRTERYDLPGYSFSIVPGLDYQGPLCARPDFRTRLRLLQVPSRMDPRVRELALSIVRGCHNGLEAVHAVETYLTTHHKYSLSVDPGPGDPVTNFLLKNKDAHCEYFASAAAILLRYARVPTRYVTGYYAHESSGTDELVVRERDAHAWAESYIDGMGWVTVEATPADGRPDGANGDLPVSTRIWEWLQDATTALRDWLADRTPIQMISVLGVLGLVFASIQIWRQLRSRPPGAKFSGRYDSPGREVEALARGFDAELRRRGRNCPAAMTWEEYARSVPAGTLPPAVREFISAYNRLRFGAGPSGQHNGMPVKPLNAEVESLRRILELLQAEPIRPIRPIRRGQ